MQVVTPSALFAGHNNRHHWAALTTTNDGDKSGVGEGFERSALSPALNTPALQVKIGNSKGGFEARRRCRPRHFLPAGISRWLVRVGEGPAAFTERSRDAETLRRLCRHGR